LWAISCYVLSDHPDGETGASDEPPAFTTNADTIESTLGHPTSRTECVNIWRTLWLAARTDQGPGRGKRHIILFLDEEPSGIAGHGLTAAVRTMRGLLQVVATRPSPNVEEFCRQVQGTFQIAETAEDIAAAFRQAYLNLLARYEISYQSAVPDCPSLKIRVHSPMGWGETTVRLTSPLPASPGSAPAGR
jgi:hypothetical protein